MKNIFEILHGGLKFSSKDIPSYSPVSSKGTGNPELQDASILSKEDLAIVMAVKRTYGTRDVMDDTDGMNALLRTINVIRAKAEYNGKYDSRDADGNYVSVYNYSSSKIETKINIHAHSIKKGNILAYDSTIFNSTLMII